MSYYIGEKCLICNKEFTESDDIVVCPECGTPYHRSCYKEKKQCVNSALHKTGGSWMADTGVLQPNNYMLVITPINRAIFLSTKLDFRVAISKYLWYNSK